VVSKQRIRARPRQFYVDLLARLNELGPEDDATPYAVENCWHAIFVSLVWMLGMPVISTGQVLQYGWEASCLRVAARCPVLTVMAPGVPDAG
jgi:Protein of unknown function (DUF3431)